MDFLSLQNEFESNLQNFVSDEQKIFGQNFVELEKKISKIEFSIFSTKKNIKTEQNFLKEEFEIISSFWMKILQEKNDQFLSDLSKKWTAIERIQTNIQILKKNFEKIEKETKFSSNQSLLKLENLFHESRQECQKKKDKCLETHTRVQLVKKDFRDVKQHIKRDNMLLQEKEKLSDQLQSEIQKSNFELENAKAELESVTSSMLDDSFGQNFREIEMIMVEFHWDFAKLENLLMNRGEFQRRIERVEADKTGKERARQHKEMAKKHAILKKENDRLHALQFRLKKEVISAERDLELAAGIRRFTYEPTSD